MEYRKLIMFGNSSYIVTLPKGWVRKNNLKAGELLTIEENKDGILVRPKEIKRADKQKMGEISVDGKSKERIETEIVSLYLTNCSTVEVFGKELNSKISFVKGVFKNLPGMEIMEENSKRIAFKDLMDANELSVKTIIRRIDMIIRGMLQDATDGDVESLRQRDLEVNRLCFLCHRAIRNIMAGSGTDVQHIEMLVDWQIVTRLEEIGDFAKASAEFIRTSRADATLRKKLLDAYRITIDAYLKVMKAYYENDSAACHEIEIETKQHIREDLALLQMKHDPASARLVDCLNQINISVKMISRQIINLG